MSEVETKFQIAATAAERIRALVAEDPSLPVLRVAVEGGGCSGFRYEFTFVAAAEGDDTLFELGGARVAIDPASLEFLLGSTLEYADEMLGQFFHVKNPAATSACGCGVSFSV